MRKRAPAILAVVFLIAQAVISSQSAMPPRAATDVPDTDIRAVIAKAPPDGIQDQQIRVVDMGKYNVAVGVLHRSAKPAQQGAIDHAPERANATRRDRGFARRARREPGCGRAR
jgi:hypothetical protein